MPKALMWVGRNLENEGSDWYGKEKAAALSTSVATKSHGIVRDDDCLDLEKKVRGSEQGISVKKFRGRGWQDGPTPSAAMSCIA